MVPGQWTILLPQLNLNSLETSGLDFEVSYQHEIGPGTFGVRALATDTYSYKTQVSRRGAGEFNRL